MNPIKSKGRAGGIFYLLFRNLFFLSLVLPLFFLLLFSFTERYAWPELFPTSFSLRSFKSILFQRKALCAILYPVQKLGINKNIPRLFRKYSIEQLKK